MTNHCSKGIPSNPLPGWNLQKSLSATFPFLPARMYTCPLAACTQPACLLRELGIESPLKRKKIKSESQDKFSLRKYLEIVKTYLSSKSFEGPSEEITNKVSLKILTHNNFPRENNKLGKCKGKDCRPVSEMLFIGLYLLYLCSICLAPHKPSRVTHLRKNRDRIPGKSKKENAFIFLSRYSQKCPALNI